MIHLTCTKCQTALALDDAFAGGVCRCQKCGAIQTVPSQPKSASTPTRRRSGNTRVRAKLLLLMLLVLMIALAGLVIAGLRLLK